MGLFDNIGGLGDVAAKAGQMMDQLQPALLQWSKFLEELRDMTRKNSERLKTCEELLILIHGNTSAILATLQGDPKDAEYHAYMMSNAKNDPRVNELEIPLEHARYYENVNSEGKVTSFVSDALLERKYEDGG